MKNLLLYLFFGIFVLFQPNAKGEEAEQSSWIQIITLKTGANFGGTISNDFYDTYNSNNSFPRPIFFSEARWADFEAPKRNFVFGAEAGFRINGKISVGIAGQHHSSDKTDKLTYTGIVELPTGVLEDFRNIDERHHFRSKATHLFAFMDYRLFEKRSLSPVFGLGIGLTFSSVEWNWDIEGRSVIGNTLFILSDDQIFMNIDNKRSFAVQPRFRLEYAFPGSGFFDSVFLQTDYIFSKYDADYFENFRDLALDGEPFESLPQELQTDAIRKLYDRYDVNAGGFELMVGLTLSFSLPDVSAEDE